MTTALSPSIPKKLLNASILAIYVCFCIFGLGLHHWSGGHWHSHSQAAVVQNTSGGESEVGRAPEHSHPHGCCHSKKACQTSELDPADSQLPRVHAPSTPCEVCQQWASIVQSSQAFDPIEAVVIDRTSEIAISQPASLLSDTLVAWNSRGPPPSAV